MSPELVVSDEFHTEVFVKATFFEHLHAAFVNEAHCISLWGGNFHPDYAELGTLRSHLPCNIPIAVISATLPEHIMDDIHSKLQLSNDDLYIAVTNRRPDITLSV